MADSLSAAVSDLKGTVGKISTDMESALAKLAANSTNNEQQAAAVAELQALNAQLLALDVKANPAPAPTAPPA